MIHRPLLLILTLSAGAGIALGQAMVERGAIDGRSATATAGAGAAAAKIFGKTNRSMVKASETPPPAPVGRPMAPAEPEPERKGPAMPEIIPPAPAFKPDYSAIAVGMDRADLIRAAGKPSMSVSGAEGSVLVETFWYRVGSDTVTIVLRGGKIASITGLEKLTARQ